MMGRTILSAAANIAFDRVANHVLLFGQQHAAVLLATHQSRMRRDPAVAPYLEREVKR